MVLYKWAQGIQSSNPCPNTEDKSCFHWVMDDCMHHTVITAEVTKCFLWIQTREKFKADGATDRCACFIRLGILGCWSWSPLFPLVFHIASWWIVVEYGILDLPAHWKIHRTMSVILCSCFLLVVPYVLAGTSITSHGYQARRCWEAGEQLFVWHHHIMLYKFNRLL